MAYNTGNPIGSTDPRDLVDNAENFDKAVNAEAQDSWTDRLGRPRKTWDAIEREAAELTQAATEQADRAEQEADRAEQEADRAEQEADRAEAASDIAFVNAAVYESVADGLAATTDGEQFSVVEGTEIVRYLNDDGSEVEVARYPTADVVRSLAEKIIDLSPRGTALAFIDDFGRAPMAVADDGSILVYGLSALRRVLAPIVGTEQGWLEKATPPGYALSLTDDDGMVAFGVTNDGGVVAPRLERVTTINGVAIEEYRGGGTAAAAPRFMAEIVHIISYGQSLSVGWGGTPPVSTTQNYDSLKFSGGVRTQDTEGDPYEELVPLTETESGVLGETPISGAADALKQLIFSENGLDYTEYSCQFLGSAPGKSGAAIASLMPGTTPFNRMLADIQAGYDLSQAQGKLYKVGAMFWTQGESDYSADTPAFEYKDKFEQLIDELDSEAKAITGQAETVQVIGYQVQGHATFNHPQDPYIAVAQLELSEALENYHIACPLYWSAQTVHQSAINYRRLGAYYGLCAKRVLVDQAEWKPLSPVQISSQGNIILVRFHVPYGALEFDTLSVPAAPNMGFSVVDESLGDIAIAEVSIVGPDTVKISCESAVAGGRVRYGFTTGRGGNLRDQQGERIIFDPLENPFPMHNWCVIFDKTI